MTQDEIRAYALQIATQVPEGSGSLAALLRTAGAIEDYLNGKGAAFGQVRPIAGDLRNLNGISF